MAVGSLLYLGRRGIPLLETTRCFLEQRWSYAKTVLGAVSTKGKVLGGALDKKKGLPVETDPEKLVNYCCGANIYKEGEEIKLKDDSEYPEWLWTLRLGPEPPLEEMDPNTREYWERLFYLNKIRKLRLMKTRPCKKMFVNVGNREIKFKELKTRALAYKWDPGYDEPPKFDKDRWRII